MKRVQDFFGNFYTTGKPLKDLFWMGIRACGNILSNHRGCSSELKTEEFDKKSTRSDFRWFMKDEIILTVKWQDNKTMYVITFHCAISTVNVTKWTKVNNGINFTCGNKRV